MTTYKRKVADEGSTSKYLYIDYYCIAICKYADDIKKAVQMFHSFRGGVARIIN